jgi:hypothetical protein
MYGDCPDCKRLWEDYSDATKAHVSLVGKTQLAQIEQNSAVLKELEPLKLAAGDRRGKARMALKEHEAIHRTGKPR